MGHGTFRVRRTLAVLSKGVSAALVSGSACAAGTVSKGVASGYTLAPFLFFVALTLGITYWASHRNRSVSQFYTAGGSVTPLQNGFALAGDYMSASSFLGAVGMMAGSGYDSIIYGVGTLIGWPILLFLVAEPLRNLGRFTLADVVAFRLEERPVRILAAVNSLVIVLFYLVIQLVGAGKLIQLLFGVPYMVAMLAVGALVLVYVLIGGMLATTWVQIVKAVLMLVIGTYLAFTVLQATGFSANRLIGAVVQSHPAGAAVLAPSRLVTDPVDAISLGMSLIFGMVGLPHILSRLFTVRDGAAARQSAFYATGLIAWFYTAVVVIGAGAIVFVLRNPAFVDPATHVLIGGGNMTAMHLSHYFGGDVFLGIMSAVAFATILAVVAGLTISGASAVGHDLYKRIVCRGQADPARELTVSRCATFVLVAAGLLLSHAVQNLNISFLVGLAFSISASTNFPILMLSMFWRRLTTRGVLAGGIIGLVSSVGLLVAGPTIWVGILKHDVALFPYANPALFSMTLAFGTAWLASITDTSGRAAAERARFDAQMFRSVTGIGSSAAQTH
ncbi:cation acetate symporter [Burkholderia sp. Ac-20353]|uniref:sodium:solute symporter family transporter n=1 Tax=Burkholderia sp. Ac-20353 TaxID=2703894 RepID=UPI00197BCE42|nr:cation acetate symporter [Burkholderia sp. Ac-20353]MBN3786336.1 cation/acetate symporter ActP [Burkholderia sp. Ac-20353]